MDQQVNMKKICITKYSGNTFLYTLISSHKGSDHETNPHPGPWGEP